MIKLKNLFAVIFTFASLLCLIVAFILIPRMQYPVLTYNDDHTTKWVDYYLDAQKVSITVYKQTELVEFGTQVGKFTLVGKNNFDLMVNLIGKWNKTSEDAEKYILVPKVVCTSLLLRFKHLDYTQLEAISCNSKPVQYSELIPS